MDLHAVSRWLFFEGAPSCLCHEAEHSRRPATASDLSAIHQCPDPLSLKQQVHSTQRCGHCSRNSENPNTDLSSKPVRAAGFLYSQEKRFPCLCFELPRKRVTEHAHALPARPDNQLALIGKMQKCFLLVGKEAVPQPSRGSLCHPGCPWHPQTPQDPLQFSWAPVRKHYKPGCFNKRRFLSAQLQRLARSPGSGCSLAFAPTAGALGRTCPRSLAGSGGL